MATRSKIKISLETIFLLHILINKLLYSSFDKIEKIHLFIVIHSLNFQKKSLSLTNFTSTPKVQKKNYEIMKTSGDLSEKFFCWVKMTQI